MAKATVAERNHQIEYMRECIQAGDTLYFIWRGSSASGLARYFDVYTFPVRDGKAEPLRFTYAASLFCGTYDKRREAVRINGCGFSAEQEITEALSRALFGASSKLEYRRIG